MLGATLDLLPRHGDHQKLSSTCWWASSCSCSCCSRSPRSSTSPTATPSTPPPIQVDWFNPFAVESFSAFAAGLSLSIFIYWGWDVTLTMNEETKDPEKTPGRAATVTVRDHRDHLPAVALATLILRRRRRQAELGLGNPEIQGNMFFVLAGPVLGPVRHADVAGRADAARPRPCSRPSCRRPAPCSSMGHYRALPQKFAQDQPHAQVAELRHDRLGRRCRGVLRHHAHHVARTHCGTPSRRWA